MYEDKRRSSRQRLFLRGFIRVPEIDLTLDCIVRDISESGAKLRFRAAPSLPELFELHIPAKGHVVQSKKKWMGDCEVGISFEYPPVSAAPPSGDGELLARMAKLEDEITLLKKVLKCLQNQEGKTEAA
jgi:hypothetical protein